MLLLVGRLLGFHDHTAVLVSFLWRHNIVFGVGLRILRIVVVCGHGSSRLNQQHFLLFHIFVESLDLSFLAQPASTRVDCSDQLPWLIHLNVTNTQHMHVHNWNW